VKWEADSLLRSKNYKEAIEKYKQHNSIKENRNDLYLIAVCYCNLNETDSAAYYFNELLKNGFCYRRDHTLSNDENLPCLNEHSDYEKFNYLDSLNYEEFTKEFNAEVSEEFLKRREIDQAVTVVSIDSVRELNMFYLDSILKVYKKWPGYSIIGKEGDNAAWLIAQHADRFIDFQEKCYQYLLEAMEESNTNPNNIAYLYDRIQINKGLQQKYGTQIRIIEGEIIFINLESEENIDKYRAYFNLSPLSFYKRINGKEIFK
jgi:pentatricopeptide repeat protein